MTNLTGSANFLKYVLFLLNFLFVITGIIILSIGAVIQGVYHGYSGFLTEQFLSLPVLLIVIGALIFIIAFFGCCGAWRENYCMVLTFSVLLGVIFIMEFSAGIAGYVLRNDTHDILRGSLNTTLYEYKDTKNYGYITNLWDRVQTNFECCGVDNSTDWMTAFESIPVSCCPAIPGTMATFECNSTTTTLFAKGCLITFGDYIKAHAVSLGAAGLVIALFQLIGVFATCFVARKIRHGVPPSATGHDQF